MLALFVFYRRAGSIQEIRVLYREYIQNGESTPKINRRVEKGPKIVTHGDYSRNREITSGKS